MFAALAIFLPQRNEVYRRLRCMSDWGRIIKDKKSQEQTQGAFPLLRKASYELLRTHKLKKKKRNQQPWRWVEPPPVHP